MKFLSERKWLENSIEYIVGLMIFGICFRYRLPSSLPEKFSDILAQSISVSSIIVGFLVAAKSILIALDDKPIIGRLKKLGKYNLLVSYFMRAIIASFVWSLSSGTLMFLPTTMLTKYHHVIIAFWFGLSAISITSCAKIIHLLGGILKHKPEEMEKIQ